MKKLLTVVAVGILMLSSLLTPASASRKGGDILENKSPCFEEDVRACLSEGRQWNWSQCYCLPY